MTKVIDVINALENLAPAALKEDFDNVGLMFGNPDDEVTGAIVCLDVTSDVVALAIKKKANVIISHHPFFFRPISTLDTRSGKGYVVSKCMANSISVISEHTNLDKAPNGLNMYLANVLGGTNIKLIDGTCGVYFEVEKKDLADFAKEVSEKLNDETVCYTNTKKKVKSVVACTGGGGSDAELYEYAKANADVYLSGDFKHHNYVDAKEDKFAVVSYSHYASEIIVEDLLKEYLENNLRIRVAKAGQTRPFNTVK